MCFNLNPAVTASAPRHKVAGAEYYQGSLFAWTAFREEQPIKTIKYDTKKGLHEVVH